MPTKTANFESTKATGYMEHGRYSKWGENIKAALLYSGEENSQAQKIHAAMQFSKRGTDTTYVVVYYSICTYTSICMWVN